MFGIFFVFLLIRVCVFSFGVDVLLISFCFYTTFGMSFAQGSRRVCVELLFDQLQVLF